MKNKIIKFDDVVIDSSSELGKQLLHGKNPNITIDGPMERDDAQKEFDLFRKNTFPLYAVKSDLQYYICH